jgi:hypothetical protein
MKKFLIVLIAAAFMLSACGGSDSSTDSEKDYSGSTVSETKAETDRDGDNQAFFIFNEFDKDLPLYEYPSEDANEVGVLFANAETVAIDSVFMDYYWFKVEYGGQAGWVPEYMVTYEAVTIPAGQDPNDVLHDLFEDDLEGDEGSSDVVEGEEMMAYNRSGGPITMYLYQFIDDTEIVGEFPAGASAKVYSYSESSGVPMYFIILNEGKPNEQPGWVYEATIEGDYIEEFYD